MLSRQWSLKIRGSKRDEDNEKKRKKKGSRSKNKYKKLQKMVDIIPTI